MSTERLVLVVDGGGSHTFACVAHGHANEPTRFLGQATGGPSNPTTSGVEAACRTVGETISEAIKSTNELSGNVVFDRVIIGISGMDGAQARQPFATWAASQLNCPSIVIASDIELLLYAGRESLATIALICGTGSVTLGRSTDGRLVRAGGRGHLLGDGGSGFWLGQQALMSSLQEIESGEDRSQLTKAVAAVMGNDSPLEWTRAVYNAECPKQMIASYAKTVCEVAEAGDPSAVQILERGSHELRRLFYSAARELQLRAESEFDLVLAGGVLTHSSYYRGMLESDLSSRGFSPQRQEIAANPALSVAACL